MRNVGSNPVRARWGFLRTLHPLFLVAESLPTIEGADEGQYDSATGYDIDHLKNQITTLRNDFKLNIIKQQLVDIDRPKMIPPSRRLDWICKRCWKSWRI
jgi:hypothetical protein